MARAAQRDRAPEHLVKGLPWRVWNGSAWEKHQGSVPLPEPSSTLDIEAAEQSASTSHDPIPWCQTQLECAICLFEFAKGDRVRELPCHHIFHLDEVDAWLINRKKLVHVLSSQSLLHTHPLHSSAPFAKQTSPNLGSSPCPKRPPIPPRPWMQTSHPHPPLRHPRNAPLFFMTDTTTDLCRMLDPVCFNCTVALLLARL